jgi:hypothetical protein
MSDDYTPPLSQSEQPEDLLLTTADNDGDDNVARNARRAEEHASSAECARNEAEQLRHRAEEAREARDVRREALEKVRHEREQLRDIAEAARRVSEVKRAEAETARQTAVAAMHDTADVLAIALDQMKVVEAMRRTLRDIKDVRKPDPTS